MQQDLFKEGNVEPKFWSDYISSAMNERVKQIDKTVNELRKTKTIYPENRNVLRVFVDIPPQNVNVVILGQDPYHDGNANGYAFGCLHKPTPSLYKIHDAVLINSGITKDSPKTEFKIDLSDWIKQGVFLLNTILTVERDIPLSHSSFGWQEFTTNIIKIINTFDRPIVFMLWGKEAKEYAKYLNNPKHLVIKETHPASASYNKTDWNTNCFNECNEFLINNNLKHIKWL